MKSNCKFMLNNFSGAKNESMSDYLKLFLRDDPDHFILHVGTNDLKSEKIDICISNITVRADNQHVSAKTFGKTKRVNQIFNRTVFLEHNM